MARFTRKRGEQIQEDIEKRESQQRSRRIDETIQTAYQKLYDGDIAGTARLMREILLPDIGVSRHTIPDHAEAVRESSGELEWHHGSLRRFVEDPDRYIRRLSGRADGGAEANANQLYLKAAGMKDPRERDREIVTEAFHSLESIAVARGYVSNSVTNFAPAFGYELQLGTWYQPPRDDMPFDIQLVDPGDSEEVTVNMGKPGRGKGVMGHTETEDRYHAGRKIIDAVDFDECEGAVYDIPMSNPTLREVREDMGLPADFTEHDEYEPPNMEIMVPLTNNFGSEHIPFYGPEPEDTVVQPFTVPASSLSKKALKRFIQGELTDTQANIFESAYDGIQRQGDDWNLSDLILAAERQRGVHGNQGAVDRVQRAIKRVANKGWIRDRDDPYAIDWGRILSDSDTITVFTASLMSDADEAEQYLYHSYLIYALRRNIKKYKKMPRAEKERRGLGILPKFTVIARELHNIAPNMETASDDETVKAVQDAMASDFRDLTAMHRHEGVEIIADTQNFIGEIKKRARVNFNRACLFNVNRSPAENMFRELAGETRERYASRVTQRFGVGECAVLGRVGTGRPFEMTVATAPPMSHHFDPDEWVNPERGITKSKEELKNELGGKPREVDPDDWEPVNSGWDLRVQLLGEEYRKAGEILDGETASDEPVDLDAVKNEVERPDNPVGQFGWDAIEITEDSRHIPLDELESAYSAWAYFNGFGGRGRSSIGRNLLETLTPRGDGETYGDLTGRTRPVVEQHEDGRKQTAVYEGLTLSNVGEWMDCCEDPEFAIAWGEYNEKGYRRPAGDAKDPSDGWTCANCGAPEDHERPTGPVTSRGDDSDDADANSGDVTEGEDGNPECPECGAREWRDGERGATCDACDYLPKKSVREDITLDIDASQPPEAQDMDCECNTPDPHPTYSGLGPDSEQTGWECGNCGDWEPVDD